MANGGVFNMNFPFSKNTPAVLRVRWSPQCSIPFHYHPTGAMYFVLYGNMFFKGDLPWGEVTFNSVRISPLAVHPEPVSLTHP